MPNDIEYTGLTIKISADSKDANIGVKAVKQSLDDLNKTAKNLDEKQIEKVKKILLDISNIDFSNVSKGLDSVVKSFKQLNSVSGKSRGGKSGGLVPPPLANTTSPFGVELPKMPDFTGIGGFDMSKINTELKTGVGLVADYNQRMQEMKDYAQSLGYVTENFTSLDSELKNSYNSMNDITQATEGLKNVMTDSTMKDGMMNLKEDFEGVFAPLLEFSHYGKDMFNETFQDMSLNMSNTATGMSKMIDFGQILTKIFSKLTSGVQKAVGGFKKLVTQFMRIVRYRIMRKIIQDVYKALQEASQELLTFDSGYADTFNNLQNSFKFLGSAVMGFIDPLIQMFEPFLTMLADGLAEVSNGIAEMFAKLNGQSGYAKAIKGAKNYASELKKTQSIGIDELNVLGNSQDQNYEWVDFGEEATENSLANMNGIAKVLTSIVAIVKDLIETLAPIFSLIMDVLQPILYLVGVIIDIIEPFLSVVLQIIAQVARLINFIFALITGDMTKVEQLGKDMINGLLKMLSTAVNFFIRILNTIAEGIERSLNSLINLFDWIWGGTEISIGRIPEQHWQAFATGGFPEDGMFFANSTELVGKFSNGKTAVANNEQITQGIYEAVRDALRDSGGNRGVTIEMDGLKVAEVVTDRQGNMSSLVKGGAVKYGS